MTRHAKRQAIPARGPKPMPAGTCDCGAPCIDYAAEWVMRPGAGYDPESASGDIPDRDYEREVWTPVCYPVTPDRYTSRPYIQHALRLADATGATAEATAIRTKYAALLQD